MSKLERLVGIYRTVQFVRFLAVGGVALVVHWLARLVINIWLDYNMAVVLAYGVGILSAYVLNKLYVFPKSGRRARTEVILFVAVNVIAFPLVWGLSWLLGEVALPQIFQEDVAKAVGHGIAILCPVFFNYAAHKFITFQDG